MKWPLRNCGATYLRDITDTVQTVQYSDSQCTLYTVTILARASMLQLVACRALLYSTTTFYTVCVFSISGNANITVFVLPTKCTFTWISWTDQLNRSARQTSWTDQFFLFEALASSHIQRFSFQFVHCRSFRVRRRPCFFGTYIIINEWDKCVAENF